MPDKLHNTRHSVKVQAVKKLADEVHNPVPIVSKPSTKEWLAWNISWEKLTLIIENLRRSPSKNRNKYVQNLSID